MNDKGNEMTATKYAKKSAQYSALKAKLDQMDAELAEIRLELLRKVTMKKNDKSTILNYGNRSIKAIYNSRRNAYNLEENGKRIFTEARASIHDLRFEIAMGNI